MSGLQDIFKPKTIKDLELVFKVSLDEHELHHVKVFSKINGKLRRLTDLGALKSYGFSIEDQDAIYKLGTKDLQTVYSIYSLKPRIKNGEFIMEMVPPVLKYLREKEISEGPASKKLRIHDAPVIPRSKLKRSKDSGILVKTGFENPETKKLLKADEVTPTKDGGYTRVGNDFFPLPRFKSKKGEKYLNQGVVRVPADDVPEFFKRDLVFLKKELNAVISEDVSKIKIIDQSFEPSVRVSISEKGWLDFDIEYNVGEYKLPHDVLLKNPEKYIRPDDDTWIKNDPETVKRTDKKLKKLDGVEKTEKGYRVPISRFGSVEEFIEAVGGQPVLAEEYEKFLDGLTGYRGREDFQLPTDIEKHLDSIEITLRPYQRAGIQWLLWLAKNNLHGLLADDMGLGKTMQMGLALAVLQQDKDHGHTMIISPKSVMHHWFRELKRINPNIKLYKYHGPNRKNLPPHDFTVPITCVSTYSTITNDIELISQGKYSTLIIDEASKIKNRTSQRTRALKRINASHRFCLSGTPIENKPSELWSIFDFLMRGHLGKYGTFERVFSKYIVSGDKKKSEQLAKRIDPFMLRRLKSEVAKDLPEKIDMDEWCELTEEQKALYGQLLDRHRETLERLKRGEKYDAEFNYTASIFPLLMKLKQVCDHPKLILKDDKGQLLGRSNKFDTILKKIRYTVDEGDQMVLFSHYLQTLDLFEEAFKKNNISYTRIDGSTDNRQELIDKYNNGGYSVMLASLMAAGYGINLQSANHVIHFDRWWNPAVEDQATDRVHRIGQDKTVYVHRLLTEGTIEERIDKLLTEKRTVAKSVLEYRTSKDRQWTREELIELLEPLDEENE